MASSARIDELRKKFDENPRRYFAPLANEYRKAGELEQALFVCEEYLPEQPGHMSGHIVYGQALFELGRHDEAKSVFQTALSLDPENLVALRHLGDIARRNDDDDAAQAWYQRVLEADPRNEEVAYIVSSMSLNGGVSTASSKFAPPPPPSASPAARSAPVEVETLEETPAPLAPVTASAPPAVHAAPEDDALEIHEFLEIDDFSFASTLGLPVAPPMPEPAGDAEAKEADDSVEAAATDVDVPSGSAPVRAEETGDEPDDDEVDEDELEEEELEEDESEDEEPEFDDEFEAIETASAAEPAVTPDVEIPVELFTEAYSDSFTETLARAFDDEADDHETDRETDHEAAETVGAAPADASPEPPVRAFLTRTMAEVYLQQGHVEPALEIYQKLLEQRPFDDQLRTRLRAVEERSPAPEPSTAEAAAGGPTIRQFLKAMVASRAQPAAPPDPIDDFGPDEQASFAGVHEGAAAHRTSGDLSLDHVFEAPRSNGAGEGLSFDEFFGEKSRDGAARGKRSGGNGAKEDVAQFNAWLNGLKKK